MSRFWACEMLDQIKDKYIHGGDEGFDQRRREALDEARNALEDMDKIEWFLGIPATDSAIRIGALLREVKLTTEEQEQALREMRSAICMTDILLHVLAEEKKHGK